MSNCVNLGNPEPPVTDIQQRENTQVQVEKVETHVEGTYAFTQCNNPSRFPNHTLSAGKQRGTSAPTRDREDQKKTKQGRGKQQGEPTRVERQHRGVHTKEECSGDMQHCTSSPEEVHAGPLEEVGDSTATHSTEQLRRVEDSHSRVSGDYPQRVAAEGKCLRGDNTNPRKLHNRSWSGRL